METPSRAQMRAGALGVKCDITASGTEQAPGGTRSEAVPLLHS